MSPEIPALVQAATLPTPRSLALFVTVPSIAKHLAKPVKPEKLISDLAIMGITPDAAVCFGDRMVPMFTPANADAIVAKLSGPTT